MAARRSIAASRISTPTVESIVILRFFGAKQMSILPWLPYLAGFAATLWVIPWPIPTQVPGWLWLVFKWAPCSTEFINGFLPRKNSKDARNLGIGSCAGICSAELPQPSAVAAKTIAVETRSCRPIQHMAMTHLPFAELKKIDSTQSPHHTVCMASPSSPVYITWWNRPLVVCSARVPR